MTERVPWKESNLALIGSDLDHKIKAAAAEGEEQWSNVGHETGTQIWRIEQFRVVPWPSDKYGQFHKGDSYVILNTYKQNDKLLYDVYIWIGAESSQDEYGTAAYKMVECDEILGGAAIQHRETQHHESPLFQSYFQDNNITYLEGGVESGFTHVEPTKDKPHLYRIKGTEKGMSLTQLPLQKTSLNKGDSFVLFANSSKVWLWNGSQANPDEKARANSLAEKMCTQGTVTVLDQGHHDDDEDFWKYLEDDGDIQEPDQGDEAVQEFAPLLFKLSGDGDNIEQVAQGEMVKVGFFGTSSAPRLNRSLLDEVEVFLVDAGWEIFVWLGHTADRSDKLSAMAKADAYCMKDPRTADLPLTLVKSGYETSDFASYFVE